MRRIALYSALIVLALAATVVAQEATTPPATTPPATAPAATTPAAMTSMQVMMKPGDVKWADAPPVFEKGAMMAVLAGNPGADGPYVVRLKMPKGYKIAPHWHPTDENVTVISGEFKVGMGEKFDEKTMTELAAGGYALLPAEMRHYAMAKGEAIVQVSGMGPFKITYVNASDDPSTKNAAK